MKSRNLGPSRSYGRLREKGVRHNVARLELSECMRDHASKQTDQLFSIDDSNPKPERMDSIVRFLVRALYGKGRLS